VNADSFSTQNLIKLALRFGIGILALLLVAEVALWAAFRAPTDGQMTLHLKNKISGLQPKVVLNMSQENQLRSINWSPGPRGTNSLRILCVGGLSTFGQLQNAPDTWWGQLGSTLQEKLPGVKVEIGANGASGFLSLVGARWVSTFTKDFQPDLIITNFGVGDVLGQPLDYKYDGSAYASLPIPRRERGAIKNALLKVSQLARWKLASSVSRDTQRAQDMVGDDDFFTDHFTQMRAEFAKIPPIPNPFRLSDADPRNEYLDAIKIINTEANSVGAKLIITGEPGLCRGIMTDEAEALRFTFMPKSRSEGNLAVRVQSEWVERETRRFQEVAQKYAEDNKLTFIELNGEVPQDAVHFVNETILTDAGAKKMAELLLPKILPIAQANLKK
jgi:lysophospholipase L1-like esterase